MPSKRNKSHHTGKSRKCNDETHKWLCQCCPSLRHSWHERREVQADDVNEEIRGEAADDA